MQEISPLFITARVGSVIHYERERERGDVTAGEHLDGRYWELLEWNQES